MSLGMFTCCEARKAVIGILEVQRIYGNVLDSTTRINQRIPTSADHGSLSIMNGVKTRKMLGRENYT